MKYPTLANWIRFKKVSEDEYEVYDLVHERAFKTNAYTVWFAKQLNGKRNPYRIDRELPKERVDHILSNLKECDVTRDSRFLSKSFLSTILTLWIPNVTKKMRLVSYLLNALLLISFIPMLIFSIFYFVNYVNDINTDYIITGSFVGIFIGIFLHEMGHMIACLAYGGQVFEVGVLLQFFIPGAYVLMSEENIKERMKRIQVSAAGIEMNLLLVAICVILSVPFEELSGFFLSAAINNLLLAFLNLTFIEGFDGMSIISELFGVEGLVSKSKRITKSKWKKSKLQKDGVCGNATIVACYIFKVIQIALPLVFAVNIIGVISCFL